MFSTKQLKTSQVSDIFGDISAQNSTDLGFSGASAHPVRRAVCAEPWVWIDHRRPSWQNCHCCLSWFSSCHGDCRWCLGWALSVRGRCAGYCRGSGSWRAGGRRSALPWTWGETQAFSWVSSGEWFERMEGRQGFEGEGSQMGLDRSSRLHLEVLTCGIQATRWHCTGCWEDCPWKMSGRGCLGWRLCLAPA